MTLPIMRTPPSGREDRRLDGNVGIPLHVSGDSIQVQERQHPGIEANQLGAFRERQGAEQLQNQAGAALDGIAPMLAVFSDNLLYRVQAGPFTSREEAARAAERVREKLLLVPLVLERR
jgi:rare lipoprotein A